MTLEEYSYKIEIRKGTLHSNADAMSRGCHGPKCICEDVARWESSHKVTPGKILLNNVFGILQNHSISPITEDEELGATSR